MDTVGFGDIITKRALVEIATKVLSDQSILDASIVTANSVDAHHNGNRTLPRLVLSDLSAQSAIRPT